MDDVILWLNLVSLSVCRGERGLWFPPPPPPHYYHMKSFYTSTYELIHDISWGARIVFYHAAILGVGQLSAIWGKLFVTFNTLLMRAVVFTSLHTLLTLKLSSWTAIIVTHHRKITEELRWTTRM